MKVVHIIIGLNIGGAELMMKRLIENQAEDQLGEHIVISLTDGGALATPLRKRGVRVICLGVSSVFGGLSGYFKLCRLLKELNPDIVQTWMYHADLIGGLAAKTAGFKNIVWNVRSTYINKGGSKLTLLVRKVCALLSYRVPKKIICVAEVSRKVHESLGYCPSKMVVLPNGFSPNKSFLSENEKLKLRNELGVSDKDVLIISVGRFNPDKDHKTLISAGKIVSDESPNVKFLLVGRNVTFANEELSGLINQSECNRNFILLGERSDVANLLSISDIFCLHSITEGFPNVLGEAMLSKLPCVTSDVGDAAYLLCQPNWTIAPSNPRLLARKLMDLISMSHNERKKIGAKGHQRILQHFTMKAVSDRYVELYQELIRKS